MIAFARDRTMCNYCGCREFPLIGRLSQEHWDIAERSGALRRAIGEKRHDRAMVLLDELLARLIPHTAIEESGLFAELRADGITPDRSASPWWGSGRWESGGQQDDAE
ncbi:hypothetical protein [Nonomuraea fuscirosea]|uniref:hypothetical protein n=1 Tax=Nonomuraea fuscirosea TaxID=1291556 RepID=UPI0033C0F073